MRPAFRSTGQLATFSVILAFALTLPITLSWFNLPSREQLYSQGPSNVGPFSYFRNEIFQEKSDIDFLFIGPSLLWVAIDARYLQEELSRKIGRPATVIVLGSNWRGEDLYFTLFKDIIARRKVRNLILTMPTDQMRDDSPHSQAYHWMAFGQYPELVAELPLRQKLQLYAMNILGAPKVLLSVLRQNPSESVDTDSNWKKAAGAYQVRQGYKGEKFKELEIRPPTVSAEEMIAQSAPQGTFQFTGPELGPYQMGVNRALFSFAKQYSVPVSILNIPLSSKRADASIAERMNCPAVFDSNIKMIGIPPARLFKNMPESSILQHYYDDHLNINGNRYFTRAIAPALLRIYEENSRFAH